MHVHCELVDPAVGVDETLGKFLGMGSRVANAPDARKLRDILEQKRKLGPSRGYHHYEHLADYQLTDYIIYNLFPNSVFTVGPDGVQLLRPRPHATDPNKMYYDIWT